MMGLGQPGPAGPGPSPVAQRPIRGVVGRPILTKESHGLSDPLGHQDRPKIL
jgi:hypothetical protein